MASSPSTRCSSDQQAFEAAGDAAAGVAVLPAATFNAGVAPQPAATTASGSPATSNRIPRFRRPPLLSTTRKLLPTLCVTPLNNQHCVAERVETVSLPRGFRVRLQ